MGVIPNVHKARRVGDCDTEGSGVGGEVPMQGQQAYSCSIPTEWGHKHSLPPSQLPEKMLVYERGRVRGLPEMASCKVWGESEHTGNSLPHLGQCVQR